MALSKPELHLRRVTAASTDGPLEVYPVTALPADAHLGRRGFLGAGVAVASVVAGAVGCGQAQPPAAQPNASTTDTTDAAQRIGTVVYAHKQGIKCLAIAHDAMLLASVSPQQIKVWGLPDGKLLCTLKEPQESNTSISFRVALSPDGKSLFAGVRGPTKETTGLKIWKLPEGAVDTVVPGLEVRNQILDLVVTPNGKYLVTSSENMGSLCVWDLTERKVIHELKFPDPADSALGVLTLTLSPNGSLLAARGIGHERRRIQLWSLPDGSTSRPAPEKRTWRDKSGSYQVQAEFVAFQDGRVQLEKADGIVINVLLETLSEQDQVYVRQIANASIPTSVDGGPNKWGKPVPDMAITPDGKAMVIPLESGFALWDLTRNDYTRHLWTPEMGNRAADPGTRSSRDVQVVVISPDGMTLAVGSKAGAVSLWDLPPGQEPRAVLSGHNAAVTDLAITPDGSILVSADDSGAIILWNLDDGTQQGFLFDPEASKTDGNVYTATDTKTGRTVTFSQPCGSPVPSGATCTCNCVPGTYYPQSIPLSRGPGACSCNPVCTCVPVYKSR